MLDMKLSVNGVTAARLGALGVRPPCSQADVVCLSDNVAPMFTPPPSRESAAAERNSNPDQPASHHAGAGIDVESFVE